MENIDIGSWMSGWGFDHQGMLFFQAFIIVFITGLANFLALKLIRQLIRQAERSKNDWDDILLLSARKPVSILVWIVGVSWAVDLVATDAEVAIFEIVEPVREMAVIIMLTWFMVSFIRRAEFKLANPDSGREPMDQTTVAAIGKLLRLSIIITSALVILQTLGYSISGVLAFGGIGGLAIGFAAKDLLANFFGGLMVYLDRPFVVGDWVRSPDRSIEGTVEAIGWRLTCIRTFDKRPLYVPNSIFTSITVENPSRMTNRRIYEIIGVRYEDSSKLGAVIQQVKEMLESHPEIDSSKTLIVNFDAFAPSALNFFVYTFTKTTDWIRFHEIKQDVLLKILEIIHKNGADVAFPTSTLHLPDPVKLERIFGEEP